MNGDPGRRASRFLHPALTRDCDIDDRPMGHGGGHFFTTESTVNIVNLTPHPVTIVRPGCEPLTYAAADPSTIPRATETIRTDTGCWRLAVTGDTQDAYENAAAMLRSGLVENRQYSGIEGLPDLTPEELSYGVREFRIVSIVTAIGALAAGRAIVDLLVPCGQVRDPAGRIVGATALAPATSLLSPMAERLGAR